MAGTASNRPLQIYRLASSADGANRTLVRAGPTMLLTFDCYNTGPGGLRAALYDKATTPVDGDVPMMTVFLSGQGKGGDTWPLPGVLFKYGLGFSLMPEVDGEVAAGEIIELNIGYTDP